MRTSSTAAVCWSLFCLVLVGIVAEPVLAQNADTTAEFQQRRREIEARWLAAHNAGDTAAKAAAVEELRALGLNPPAEPAPAAENTSGGSFFEQLIEMIRRLFGLGGGDSGGGNAGGGDTGLGEGGNQQPPAPTFRVIVEKNDGTALTGAAATFLVGEKVELRARIEPLTAGGTVPTIESHRWTIPGGTIKSYSLDLEASQSDLWNGRSGQVNAARHMNSLILTQAPMTDADRSAATVSFYWTNDGQNRAVRCTVRAGGAEATGEATINVRRSDNPARELYTNSSKFSGNWDVLTNHDSWHGPFAGTDRFIYFHREFLRGYTVWRQLFGYPPHTAVADTGQPGGGGTKPTYLTAAGGTATSDTHGVTKLGDFANVSDLGDDLESPWHNNGHMVEAGRLIGGTNVNTDMRSTLHATKCEVFYMWHQKIDDTAAEYEGLRRP